MIGIWYELQGQNLSFWLAQLSGPGVSTPEEAALIFSGPQFFYCVNIGDCPGLRLSAPADKFVSGGGHFLRRSSFF